MYDSRGSIYVNVSYRPWQSVESTPLKRYIDWRRVGIYTAMITVSVAFWVVLGYYLWVAL